MLIYFHEPNTVGLQNNLRVIYDDTSTIAMLDFWVKFKEIELYVEHEVDNPIIVDEIFLLTTGEGDVEGVEVDGEGDDKGVESDDEGDLEKVESGEEGDVGEVQADGEGVSATGIEVDEDIGMESGGHISLGSTVREDNDSEVSGNEYASDFATSDGVDNVADEYVGDFATSDRVNNVADEYADDFATSNGLDNVAATRSGEEEDGNEIEVWDSDEYGSLVESNEDEEHENSERKRSKFPVYNDMCIASPNCPWRIRASYGPVAKCLQIKTFQNKHHCSVSFKNKMVATAMIAQHFEATIKDHPKMNLREIQKRCAFEMHVNVTIDCCYRAKKIVNEKMAGNHKDEFGLLWDYAHELRSKIPGSTIKMVVQRGLEIAISDILPRVEHRNCARHVFTNWSGRKLGKSYECDFWQIAKCTTEKEWEDLCSALEKKDKDQDAQPPKQKGKSSIKRSTTLDKSKGNLLFFADHLVTARDLKSTV
ncbi:hypothetical protein GOBAR_AA12928 [Gossypium barbadense]|uniref:Transposase MuDR plant domain-containing protein n=1 Tax=Gossypium barbadense TaxID=3634 RepID=A0A2P5XWL7_GOSBA|nr:hypothetical protein GOBAR_AA12928 [Gossypium barbadense]